MSYVNSMSVFIIRLKCLLFIYEKNWNFLFCNICKGGKPNYKNESIESKTFKKYATLPIFKGKSYKKIIWNLMILN